ncbi:MAG: MFS transporter [Dehalococcoidales bacterium]|nr:MFS transporter [Dehalococcoidales bacterium]
MFKFLTPKPTISDRDLSQGLRWMALEGGFSQGFFSITTSGFLAAFALALGANNLQIGILAAIPFIMQIVQLPSIWLVEKIRWRKAIAVLSWFPAQLLWIPIALIPYFMDIPGRGAVSLLLLLMTCRGLLTAVCNTAWNGWIRDLVPQSILGRFFSRRLILATIISMAFSLGAAFFVDYWESITSGSDMIHGYIYVLLFGAIFLGLASPVLMSLIPEPLMQPPAAPQPSLEQRLTAPLKDRNFRRLLQFLLIWGFASNLAIPFFAVYMLVRLGFPLALVIGFSILSQIFNIIFLRIWGRYVDRFGSKVILSICASLYLLVIFGWIFTTMPERYFLTIPLLVVLYIFAGIATAGVNLAVMTIGLKLAPKGESTTYLAGASLATSIGAGLGPLCGGLLADFFASRQLNLTFSWVSPDTLVEMPALSIIGLDFLFGIAFIFGIITLGLLAGIREEGEATREVVLESLIYPGREVPRQVSSAPSYSLLNNFPFSYLKRIPLPGIDAVLGVTAYQIAETARAAASAAVSGQRLTKQLALALEKRLPRVWKNKKVLGEHAVEISREVARGAMHVVDKKPLPVEKVVGPVASGIVEVTEKAGVNPMDSILGASRGVIQGASETGMDLSEATVQTLEAAREIAKRTGISQEEAIIQAAQGALQAAEGLGPEAAAEIVEYLPDDAFKKQRKKKTKKGK